MPGVDGFTLCSKIREQHTYPIIMLTARVEDADKITGLAIGAHCLVEQVIDNMCLLIPCVLHKKI